MTARPRLPVAALVALGVTMTSQHDASASASHYAVLLSHHLRFTVGKQALPEGRALADADVRAAVEAYNAHHRSVELDEHQELNPAWVNPAEALAFLAGLARQPAAVLDAAAAAVIDLASADLRLHHQDGFGVHGLAARWTLSTQGGPTVEPEHDVTDVVAELAAATHAEAGRTTALAAAEKKLAATPASDTGYGQVFRDRFNARIRLGAVQQIRLAAARRLRPLVPEHGTAHGHSRAALDADIARIEKALSDLPPIGGGMPGGVRPMPE